MSYGPIANLGRYAALPEVFTSILQTVQQDAMDAAKDYIDSFLRAQFTLPLTQFGKDIERAEAVVAAYDLLVVRGYNPEAGNDGNFQSRWQQTTDWLKMVSRGDVVPNITDSSPGAGPDGATSEGPQMATGSQRGYSSRGRSPQSDSFFGTNSGGFFQGD